MTWLECGLEVTQGHWKWYYSKAWYCFLFAFHSNYGHQFRRNTRTWQPSHTVTQPCLCIALRSKNLCCCEFWTICQKIKRIVNVYYAVLWWCSCSDRVWWLRGAPWCRGDANSWSSVGSVQFWCTVGAQVWIGSLGRSKLQLLWRRVDTSVDNRATSQQSRKLLERCESLPTSWLTGSRIWSMEWCHFQWPWIW